MKKILLIITVLTLLPLTACSNPNKTKETVVEEFIEVWNKVANKEDVDILKECQTLLVEIEQDRCIAMLYREKAHINDNEGYEPYEILINDMEIEEIEDANEIEDYEDYDKVYNIIVNIDIKTEEYTREYQMFFRVVEIDEKYYILRWNL